MDLHDSGYELDNDCDEDYVLLTDTFLKVVDTREAESVSPYFANSLPNIQEEEEYELDSARGDAKSFLRDIKSGYYDQNKDSNNDILVRSEYPFKTTASINVKSNGDKPEANSSVRSEEANAMQNLNVSELEGLNILPSPQNIPQKSTYIRESLNVKPVSNLQDRNCGDRVRTDVTFADLSILKRLGKVEDINQQVLCHGDSCNVEDFGDPGELSRESSLLMPSSCIDFADSVIGNGNPIIRHAPDKVVRLRNKLKHIYSQYFNQGLDPTPWLYFSGKPNVSSLVEGRVRRVLSSSHLVGPPVTAMDLKPQSGKHLMLKGERGSGKSTWLRRFAYQYGLSLLPYIDEEFDVILYLHGDMFPVNFTSDFLDLSQFLSIILPPDCNEIEFRTFCIDWMQQNSERILFLIDSSYQTFLFIQQLLKREIFPLAASIFTNSPLFEHTALSLKLEVSYEMLPWSESDILKYLRHFSKAFNYDKERNAFLECIERLNCSHLLSLPDNCSLVCLLYFLDRALLENAAITCRTDIFQVLFLYFVKQRFPQIDPSKTAILPDGVIKILQSAWNLISKLTEEDVSVPLTEICDSETTIEGASLTMSLSGWEFGEFLASKFIHLRYNDLNDSVQPCDKLIRQLFHHCWTVIEQNLTSRVATHLHKLPVFMSRLLQSNCKLFFDCLPEHFLSSLSPVARMRLNRILDDCIVEISPTATQFVDYLGKLKLPDNGPAGCANVNSMNSIDILQLRKSQLYEKEINFKELCHGKDDPKSAINREIKKVKHCSRIDSLTLIFHLDELSLDHVQTACSIFQLSFNTLTNLNIALYFKSSDQINTQNNVSKIAYVIEILASFLSKIQELKSIGLWGGFLLPNTLSKLKETILYHPALESITIKGQLEVNNQRCLGRFDPYSGIILSMILEKRPWRQVCIDLRGLSSDAKSSLNFTGLVRVVSNHNLDERLKGLSLYSMDSEPNLDQMHVASTSELNNIKSTSQAEQNLLAHIIRPLRFHSTVESITMRCKSVGSALQDNLSDMIDVCFKLKSLELEVEFIDEDFILSVGSGVVCANSLQYCTVIGKVFRRYASNAGKCITGLLQSCILSNSLKEILIKISPLYEEDIDWLLISIPSLPNIPRVSVGVTIESKVITTDPEKFSEKLKYLKYKTSHRNLELNCRISAILESSF